MKVKSSVTLGRRINANRVPLRARFAVLALFSLSVGGACTVGGARLVGPAATQGAGPPPTSVDTVDTTVANPTVTTITLTAPSSSLGLLQTLQAQATAYDASGNVLQGISFAWASSNTVVATVSNTGLITAHLVGTTEITATSGSVSSPAFAVTVTP